MRKRIGRSLCFPITNKEYPGQGVFADFRKDALFYVKAAVGGALIVIVHKKTQKTLVEKDMSRNIFLWYNNGVRKSLQDVEFP